MINRIVLIFTLVITSASYATNVVNIYTWANYIPQSIITKFEQQTGITVNLSEYDSNETLYAKLKTSPDAGYDVIIPSSYYVERMRKQGMLHKLNTKRLRNYKHLNPLLLNKTFDPGNKYSVPYFWGSTGIVINKKYFNPKTINKWSDLWQAKYKNQLLILDDMREAFAIAFIKLGYSINDTNPTHIKQAYLLLKKLMPNIKLFNSDAENNIYIDEDATIGMGWSGDIYSARPENKDLTFIYPKDGFSVWIDCMAITKYAPHLANAYKFINFIMQPKIAAQLSLITGYAPPNIAALKLLPKKMCTDPLVNPSKKTLLRGYFQEDIGKATGLYTKYWELLKIGG
ncbi:MAG: spermidine/putrescine ABC transporter substrate-binding protein [Gammaproteobacteria bacterium]|nr:spermidine/putrescine ABC transporter substrate-binding protein [Gammaproteobacteria bacterium]